MTKLFLFALFITLGLNIACARAPRTPTEPPPTPTAIVYPATWTPITTPLPPTATPRPPTQTPDPTTLEVLKAFERTRGLRVYHASLDVIANDPSGELAKSFPGMTAGDTVTLLSMDGRQNHNDSHWKMKGFILMFLSGDAHGEVEFLMLGNKLYIKGPMPLLGATEKRWYAAPGDASSNLSDSTPNDFLGDFSRAQTGFPTMRADGAENLDGKACTKYRADERQAALFFLSLDENGSIKSNLGKVQGDLERGVLNVWVCDDGYVHKLEMGIQVRAPENPNEIIAIGFVIRLNDMNIIVPLEMPHDAIPLPNPFIIPGLNPPTPTPQTA